MRLCQIDGVARAAVTPTALGTGLSTLSIGPASSVQPTSTLTLLSGRNGRQRGSRHQEVHCLALANLGTCSPAQAAPRSMAGSRKAGKASQALKPADIVVDTRAQPYELAADCLHLQIDTNFAAKAGNGARSKKDIFLETEGLRAAVKGIKLPTARKGRAKANGAAVGASDAAAAVKKESPAVVAADLAASIQYGIMLHPMLVPIAVVLI